MEVSDRRTGRTSRMLDEALASDAAVVAIVAPTHPIARDILWKLKEREPVRLNGTEMRAEFPGGKVVRVLVATPRDVAHGTLAGVRGRIFRDHTFDEERWSGGTGRALAAVEDRGRFHGVGVEYGRSR